MVRCPTRVQHPHHPAYSEQDTFPALQSSTPTTQQGPRFRPFASTVHHVTKGRYITSNDPRGYIPVYEYPLNSQWIMMDIDDGYILWTGIWKAHLRRCVADIVKMIDSQPELASVIRRVRGGYLKIQGTWMPYEVALRLARRVAWPIRDDLVPLFGYAFCLFLCFSSSTRTAFPLVGYGSLSLRLSLFPSLSLSFPFPLSLPATPSPPPRTD
ncbi:transcription regulator HTH, apses-type DNA-binding domain-containing protein [Mycena belliarum]|uniref:Transcription regulator HTH, apses-type DNA-binding domain-containing protein n=1 Tax=Mycena belliarum TaxID=1033014 RepID=A0AAD6XJC7_9AGAR|nr:transcription regulator HTH, apses-type DNA-binding domain-containing protein [Mycena belliae]